MIKFSNFIGEFGGFFILLIGSIFVFLFSQRRKIWCRKLLAYTIIRIPLFGSIIKQIYLARLCQSLGFLLESKVPLNRSVELIQKMIRFFPIEKSMQQTQTDITNGIPLNESLSKSNFYPDRLVILTRVGEETGRMDKMFFKLSEQYTYQTDRQTEMLSSLIEPFLIIGLGIIVGVILIAMYLPLFQMSTSFI